MKHENFHMSATTFYGLETVLAEELRNLGAGNIRIHNRAVSFTGDKGFLYKTNMALHTALRILVPVARFGIKNENDIYRGAKSVSWDMYLFYTSSFAVKSVVHSRHITSNTHYIALKTKDAVADFFKERYGKRPDVNTRHPDLRIHVHVDRDTCTIYIDSSGEPLFKRGYRTRTHHAPINEVLAAGMLRLAGYNGLRDYIDPMCGSGTLPVEAAMMSMNIPPGIKRSFGFEKWENYDASLHQLIRESLLKKIREPSATISGYDKDITAVTIAKENITRAHLQEYIRIERKNFFEPPNVEGNNLLLVFNPPYDERIPVKTDTFYKETGDTLKKYYTGTTAWMLTPELTGVKNTGLRPERKIKLYNGALECRFLKYTLYQGSKKIKYDKA